MFDFIKRLFNLKNTGNVSASNKDEINEFNTSINNLKYNEEEILEAAHIIPKKAPACSHCKSIQHNIKTCPQMNESINAIKTYCNNFLVNQNNLTVFSVSNYLNTWDENILKRYVNVKQINSFMFTNCVEYYNGNIDGLVGKDRYIQLIIGYECVLPLHPEIRIKRTYKKQNYGKSHCHTNSSHLNTNSNYNNNLNFGLNNYSTGFVTGFVLGHKL